MLRRFTLASLAVLALCRTGGTVAQTRPVTAADLSGHVTVLADDRFEGRKPGTAGETLTTDYIVRELTERGVRPGASGGGWLQPVRLVERGAASNEVRLSGPNGPIALPPGSIVLTGREAEVAIANAPVIFAGHGAVMPDRGVDQLAGANFAGAVALILYDGPQVEGFPSFVQRIQTLKAAGARAVIGIVAPDLPWAQVQRFATGGSVQLDDPAFPDAYGAMSWEAATAILRGAGQDIESLLNAQPGSSFRSVPLPLRADLRVTTALRPFTSNNVIGRIAGSGGGRESVVLLGHWDHLGLCRPEGAADRICNGAVDNASGIATLIEVAARLAAGPRPVRDVLIVATTAEEMGLLGAEAFARNPPVARGSIVAGLNADTMAVAPAGTPVAVIGGTPAMHTLLGRIAIGLGRRLDSDREADVMATRQDGWAFTRNGIPTMMAVSNASNFALLREFLAGPYHKPDDDLSRPIEYGGAVEDANLYVALVRALADPAQFPASPAGEVQ